MTTVILRGISNDDYHADTEHVSHSKLREFEKRGERYFYERFIAGTIAREPTRALEYGTAFEILHDEGGEVFQQFVMVAPKGHDGRTKEGKQWLAAVRASGKLGIDHDDYQCMLQMVESIRENESVMAMLEACEMQCTLRGEVFGLRMQSRPDRLCLGGLPQTGFRPFTIDLKTTKDLNDLRYPEGVSALGYHTQASLARALLVDHLRDVEGVEPETLHYLLVVEKCAPHRSALMLLSRALLDYGDQYYRTYCPRLAHCLQTDTWPRALSEVIEIGLPRRLGQQNDNNHGSDGGEDAA